MTILISIALASLFATIAAYCLRWLDGVAGVDGNDEESYPSED